MPTSSQSRFGTRRLEFLALAALLLLSVVFFWKILFLGEVSITYNLYHELPWSSLATPEQIERPSMNPDCVQSYFPRRSFATRAIRSGEIPLWNPYDFSGAPFLANFQSAVFYPVNVALYLVDPLRAMGYYLVFHFVLAGWGMFLFLRARGLPVFPSFAGAVTTVLCGFLVTRVGHPTFVATAAWVPALLWRTERLFQRPGLRRAIWLAFTYALLVLAGFPQIAFHAGYLLAAFSLYRAWEARQRNESGGRQGLLWVVGGIGLSGCLVMVQILPTYEFIQHCSRRFLPYESILSSAHHPLSLVKYLVPDFLGNPLDGTVWSTGLKRGDGCFSQNYVSTTGYVGILPLLLAWVGVWTRRRGAPFFLAVGGVTLLTVLGTPLLRLAYALPGFNFSRIDRMIYLYMLSIGILAALGADALGRVRAKGDVPGKRIFIPLAALAGLFWAVHLIVDLDPDRLYRLWSQVPLHPSAGWDEIRGGAVRSGILLAAGVGVVGLRLWNRLPVSLFRGCVLVLILLDLFPFGYRFNISRPHGDAFPPTPITTELRRGPEPARILRYGSDILFSNTASVYGISDAQGYNALTLDNYMEIMERIQPGISLRRRITALTRPEALDSPLVDMLSVDYFLKPQMGPGRRPAAVAVPNPGAMPRAFLVSRAEMTSGTEALLRRLSSPGFDPAETVYLTPPEGHDGRAPETAFTDTTAASGSVRILEYRANSVALEATSEAGAWLVLADTYDPGWSAGVDGRSVNVWRANHVQRAVWVPAGRHRVRFAYRPASFRIGAAVSLVALGLAVAGLVYSRASRPTEAA